MLRIILNVMGALFLLVGMIGFFAPGMGGTHLSFVHNIIHLISGVAAIVIAQKGTFETARGFSFLFGAVYGLLGVLGFIFGRPGSPSMAGMAEDPYLLRLLPGVLELGRSDHILHIILGVIFVIAALLPKLVPPRP